MNNKLNIYTVGACVGTLLVIFLTMLGVFLQNNKVYMRSDPGEYDEVVEDTPVVENTEPAPEVIEPVVNELPEVPSVNLDTINRIDNDTQFVTYAYDSSITLDPSLFNVEVQQFASNYPRVYEVFASCVKQYCDEYKYDYILVHVDTEFHTFAITNIPYINVTINDRDLKLCFYTLSSRVNGYLTGD